MNQPLITKYRPDNLDDYFGNKQLKITIKRMLESKKLPNALLFSGSAGTGKTTLARIIAKELNCTGVDLMEFNSASTNGIDFIRELEETVSYRPLVSDTKVIILDECHQLTTQAQNALLKTLEEPKPYVYFILCSSEPNKLIPAIRSRATNFIINTLEGEDFFNYVDDIYCREKGINIDESPLSEEFLCNLFKHTNGAPRDILTSLEKVIHINPKALDKYSFDALVEDNKDNILAKVLFNTNKWSDIVKELDKITTPEIESSRRAVVGYASAVLRNEYNKKAHLMISEFIKPFFEKGMEKASLVNACLNVFKGV